RLTDTQALGALRAIRGDVLLSPSALLSGFRVATSVEVTATLLDELAEFMREGWRPTRQELDTLLGRGPAEARAGAGVLLELLSQRDEEARDRLFRFEPLLAGGNTEAGRAVFFGNKVACSTC